MTGNYPGPTTWETSGWVKPYIQKSCDKIERAGGLRPKPSDIPKDATSTISSPSTPSSSTPEAPTPTPSPAPAPSPSPTSTSSPFPSPNSPSESATSTPKEASPAPEPKGAPSSIPGASAINESSGASSTAKAIDNAMSTSIPSSIPSFGAGTPDSISDSSSSLSQDDRILKIAIGLGVALGVLFIAVGILAIILLKRRRKQESEKTNEGMLAQQIAAPVEMGQGGFMAGFKSGITDEDLSPKELENCEILEAPNTGVWPPREMG
ncbi:hypothetical protein BJ508DRAFT_87648 [Ascobolus immersus RN42]|uniref:Mid2 domain-containing protein n=1 Tax=Ascobolus immersus RN42 TaxID=1160509 RepID=A0A3N4HHC5_ASCIM|nr:hypothetical protein BJ508DRAFT_87648 [Ascobolus immersus RN42]